VDEIFASTDDMYYWLIWLCKSLHCNNLICFLCLYMFHILLSYDSLRDLWNVYMYYHHSYEWNGYNWKRI